MARHEADREDLMREATALRRRIAFEQSPTELIVAGLRDREHLSIYFGPDPVYHFDAAGRLRRAFVEGFLFRGHGDRLVRLRRERTPHTTALLRHELSPSETAEFVSAMRERLQALFRSLLEGALPVRQRIPPDDEQIVADVARGIERILNQSDPFAQAAKGRRFQ